MKGELTVEQQFEIAKLKQQIEYASAEQLRVLFVEFYSIMLLKDNATKAILAHQWGIEHVAD
jgi:Phycobilisome degradation protein nblA